eukprot:1167131-Rhodomonas_salina.1
MPRPAAACSQRTGSRDLQEAKHDIEALIKVQSAGLPSRAGRMLQSSARPIRDLGWSSLPKASRLQKPEDFTVRTTSDADAAAT